MKRWLTFFSILVLAVFTLVTQSQGDTVLLHNGDRLIGTVQNSYFALQSPYGQIIIKNDFLKSISLSDSKLLDVKFQTINNDLFNGTILNENIQIELQTGTRETLECNIVKHIMLDTSGPSYPISTTIFTTRNNDRFSGKLINSNLELETNFMTATYPTKDFNRIAFTGDEKKEVKVLLTNGDIIEGVLKLDELLIGPDSLSRIAIAKSDLSSVQFNARKMVLKEYDNLEASEKDGDGDAVFDHLDKCPDTPWASTVDEIGCPQKLAVSRLVSKKSDSLDTDGDGVPNSLDKCPHTPQTADVDKNGCWARADILFDFDSAVIKPQYYPVLEVIAAVIKRNPDLKFEIQGKTDNIGPETYNQMLSESRAQAVKELMAGKGIDPQRLKAVGYGTGKNVASNDNKAGRALNRRIDFVPIH